MALATIVSALFPAKNNVPKDSTINVRLLVTMSLFMDNNALLTRVLDQLQLRPAIIKYKLQTLIPNEHN